MKTEAISIKGISPSSAPPAEVSVTHANKPDPEVSPKQPRRRFTAQYKLRILQDIEASSQQGHIGAILRREGLYYSNIREWRQQRDQGILHSLAPQKRGRKAKEVNPLATKVAELERENRRLHKKLQQAQTIIEVQKKVSEILGIPLNDNDEKN